MPIRWKRWTAAILLLLVAVSLGVSAGALRGTGECGFAMQSVAASTVEPAAGADACPFALLEQTAATPALLPGVSTTAVVLPAYVRALVPTRSYRIDPEPPVKPPAA